MGTKSLSIILLALITTGSSLAQSNEAICSAARTNITNAHSDISAILQDAETQFLERMGPEFRSRYSEISARGCETDAREEAVTSDFEVLMEEYRDQINATRLQDHLSEFAVTQRRYPRRNSTVERNAEAQSAIDANDLSRLAGGWFEETIVISKTVRFNNFEIKIARVIDPCVDNYNQIKVAQPGSKTRLGHFLYTDPLESLDDMNYHLPAACDQREGYTQFREVLYLPGPSMDEAVSFSSIFADSGIATSPHSTVARPERVQR